MSIDTPESDQFLSSINRNFEECQKRILALEEQNTYLRNTIVRLVAEQKGIRYEDIEKVTVSEDGTLNLIVKAKEPDMMKTPPVDNPYA